MYKALFYKEWLKLKWYICILLGLTLFMYLRLLININAVIDVKGAFFLWAVTVYKGFIIYSDIKYILPFCGFVIAAAQFLPETRNKRLRLLFHLPVDQNKALGFMFMTGLFAVLTVFCLNFFLLFIVMSFFYPFEVVSSALITALPWFFSGITAYLGAGLVIIEPDYRRKGVYLAFCFGSVMLFFEGKGFNLYQVSLWKYVLLSFLYFFAVFHPALRFKRGSL
jgi:hypothetical protein